MAVEASTLPVYQQSKVPPDPCYEQESKIHWGDCVTGSVVSYAEMATVTRNSINTENAKFRGFMVFIIYT